MSHKWHKSFTLSYVICDSRLIICDKWHDSWHNSYMFLRSACRKCARVVSFVTHTYIWVMSWVMSFVTNDIYMCKAQMAHVHNVNDLCHLWLTHTHTYGLTHMDVWCICVNPKPSIKECKGSDLLCGVCQKRHIYICMCVKRDTYIYICLSKEAHIYMYVFRAWTNVKVLIPCVDITTW